MEKTLSVGSSPFPEGGCRGRFAGGQGRGEELAEGDGAARPGRREASDTVPFLSLQPVSGGLGFLLPRDV